MAPWDPFALALLEGGLKPMPLARLDAVKAALTERPEAVAAAGAALGATYGEPRAELDDEGRADLSRAASRGWSKLDDERKTAIKRVAKLLGAEEDPTELARLGEEFGRLLGGAILAVDDVGEAICGWARVVPPTPPEPGQPSQPAYAETLLDVQAATPASSRRPATTAAGGAEEPPLLTLRGLAISCLGLGLVGVLFTVAGAFGYRALGLGDKPTTDSAEPTRVVHTIVELSPRDGLATRERALDVHGRVEPAGPRVVRVQGIRRRIGKDGRFRLDRLGLEEGHNRIGVVIERLDGTEVARADLKVDVDSLPPAFEVVSPAPNAVVFTEAVELELRVRDADAQVELRVDDAVVPAQPGVVKHTVKLPAVGAHTLRLSVVDRAGNAAPEQRLQLVRAPPVPTWFRDLPPAARPPLPLPAGLTFGAKPGEYRNTKDGSVLVWVPPGRFPFGSPRGDRDERPVRTTEVDGLFVGKLEVTWAQYLAFCKATQRKPPQRRILYRGESYVPKDAHPVVYVTWSDALAYCRWAGLRLPTEVEWEYAAKGPAQREYPWGDEPPRNNRCNRGSGRFGDARHAGDGFAYTAPVGSFPKGASPFGCLDMAGNAMEWVADWYTGPGVEANRWKVIRGGSWRHSPRDCRAANRSYHDHDQRPIDQCGFRVARSAK